jgi:uncharacterized membrane protein (UPF0127 family)
MRFPIDIIWVREGVVVDLHKNVQPSSGEALQTYAPIEPADAVLELRAGTAEKLGIQPGDRLAIRPLDD